MGSLVSLGGTAALGLVGLGRHQATRFCTFSMWHACSSSLATPNRNGEKAREVESLSMPDEVVILSPGLSQSFAIATLLQRHRPALCLLGYPLPGEKDRVRAPFARYVSPEEGESTARSGAAIMTGSQATEHVLRHRDWVELGQIKFEKRNLYFFDKIATLRRAKQLDIPTPLTWTSLEEIGDNSGPLFYKPTREGTGGPRRKVRSVETLPSLVRGGGYLFQEAIEGPSVIGFGFLADRGRVVAARVHHEMLSHPPDGGSAVVVEDYDAPRVEELARRLIADFQYSGWGLIEFKRCTRRNDFVLMEVNAKFWASLEFALRTRPLFSHLLFGISSKAEPIQRMIWPARLLRNGLIRLAVSLHKVVPAVRSYEPPTWRDWARLIILVE